MVTATAAEPDRAALVEAHGRDPVLLLPEAHQVEDADHRDAELLGDGDGVGAVVAVAVGEQDMGGAGDRLAAAGRRRTAGCRARGRGAAPGPRSRCESRNGPSQVSLMVPSSLGSYVAAGGMPRGWMDWFRAVNSYCERTAASYWSEPLNALPTRLPRRGLAGWRLARGRGDRAAQLLALILAAIGVGSYLFHTHAQVWAMLADVIPIQVFILAYLGLATVRFFAVALVGRRGGGGRLRPGERAVGARRIARGRRAAQRLGRLPAGADPDRALCRGAAPPRAGDGARAGGRRRRCWRCRSSSAPSTRRSAPRYRSARIFSGTC